MQKIMPSIRRIETIITSGETGGNPIISIIQITVQTMRKIILITLLLSFLLSGAVYAQMQGQARIDSLLTALRNYDAVPQARSAHRTEMADTAKVNLLNDLSFTLTGISPDEG